MIYTLYLFLPVAVCLFWVVLHCIICSRTDTFHLFTGLFLACALYIYAEACHAVLPQGTTMDTAATLVGQLAGPSIVPLLIIYLRRLMHSTRNHPLTYLWIVLPAVFFTSGVLLLIVGRNEAVDKLYHLITYTIYNYVLAGELFVLLIYTVRIARQSRFLPGNPFSFFFKGKRTSVVKLQLWIGMVPMVIMTLRISSRQNLYALSPWIPVTTATLLLVSAFLFGLINLFANRSKIKRSDLANITRFNYNNATKAAAVEAMMDDLLDEAEEEALKHIQEKIGENLNIEEWQSGDDNGEKVQLAERIFAAVSDSWDEDSLIGRFQHLMMDKQLFLQPKLTLDDVAEELNSNKTYVSKMVNNTYNLGFPELVNTLRVDYAEQYILSHRDAKQEEIAQKCGFLSASSFNTIFKKVTGVTPKVWIGSVDRHNQKH